MYEREKSRFRYEYLEKDIKIRFHFYILVREDHEVS